MSRLPGPPGNLVELLRARVEERSDHPLYVFLAGGEREEGPLTRGELERRARAVAVLLRGPERVVAGDRALLLFPAGLDFLAGFFGCLHAGVIAVPAPPPEPARLARTLSRLQAIVRDARPAVALTTSQTFESIQGLFDHAPELAGLRWLMVDGDRSAELASDWRASWSAAGPDTLAYLQYTSGSTSSPKGVMVSHGNVLIQAESMRRAMGYSPSSVSVIWVPNFHDDGLVQGILEPLYAGGRACLLSPLDVVQQPARWLRAVTRYGGTHGGGPNFMYELCVRRVPPEQREGLDLSSWEMAYNGAEPIRIETMKRFRAAYEPHGLRPLAVWSAYGMAETTLLISAGGGESGPPVFLADRAALEGRHQVTEVSAGMPGSEARPVVSCGVIVPDMDIAIVHPEKRTRCAPDEVGEIWTCSPSNAQGYWERPQDTEETFQARLADEPAAGPFLRTGDLGFVRDGQVYVTGRYKDLIIVGGRNIYPQDIELTAEGSHPALRPGGGVAFSVAQEAGEGEALVVVQEVDPKRAAAGYGEVLQAVRAAVTEAHEAPVQAVVLIAPGTIPKTSSGKLQRRACKADFEAGTLERLAEWRRGELPQPSPPPAGERERPLAADLEAWLVARFAEALGVDPRDVDVDRPFARHDLDSRMAVGLSGEIERRLETRLSPTLLYEHPTISDLVRHLAGSPAPRARPQTVPSGAEPVAVIGWSCRFPGAPDRASFKRLLWEGTDAVADLPEERRSLGFETGLDPGLLPPRGGFLAEVDGFDAAHFGISPREAATMDPQQRLLLEVAWEALESAGCAPTGLAGSPTGVFVGISTGDYASLQVRFGDPAAVEPHMGTGTSHSIAANRLSYFLGLRGPSLAVDTACSSSLVAVHLACRSLRSGESRMALAGGVNLILWPRDSLIFTRAGMLAPDGRCKTFDASADGYSRGEGCGMVVLKRLSDALADGDPIVALVRGTAVNQDGFSSGLTAPNGEAQREVVRAALADAGAAPAEIGYVEAHGTGTALGDPIEVRALGAALGEGREAGSPFRLGSVKTNIGHLEAAAGIAGMIKALLILEHGSIPPHLHLREVNPFISLAEAGAEIPTRLTPWPAGKERRLVGVSSFGFGGTNAHVVLEEAPAQAAAVEEEGPQLFVLSARTESALRALAGRFAVHLEASAEPLPDLCHTAAVGRAVFRHRLAVVAETKEELGEKLAAFAEGRPASAGGKEPALEALGAAWVRGEAVDWAELFRGRRRVAAPTYPFEHKRFWLEIPKARPEPPQSLVAAEKPLPVQEPPVSLPAEVEGILRMQAEAMQNLAAMQMQLLAEGGWAEQGGGALSRASARGRDGEGSSVPAGEDPSPALPRFAGEGAPAPAQISAALAVAVPCKAVASRLPAPSPPFDLPLTEAQADLYTVAQISPEAHVAYNEVGVFDLRGPLDLAALRRALQALVDRHESLRTVLPGGEIQRVLPAFRLSVPLLDASDLPADDRVRAVSVWLEEESRVAFDFARGPLIRAAVMRLDRRSHLLLLAVHHVIADGLSIAAILLGELFVAYESARAGVRSRLRPALQMREYIDWLAEPEQQEAMAAGEAYWLSRFSGPLPVFEPSTDRPRPAARSFRGARLRRAWTPELRREVHALGRRHRATFFIALFAAYTALLHRWTGQHDVAIGVPTARRPPDDLGGDRLVGHCVDMAALRSRLGEHAMTTTFADHLAAIRTAAFDAQEHGGYPFARLLRAIRAPRDPSRAPLVNTVFNLDQDAEATHAGGLEIAWQSPAVHAVKYDLTLHALETRGELLLDLEYSTPLFDETTMERFHGHLRTLVEAVVDAEADPGRPLAELPLLTEVEQRQLADWNPAAAPHPAETIHRLVEAQAERTPEDAAVVDGALELTYRELNARANRLAHHLRRLGIGPEARVAICLERSAEMAVALLGTLKAGAAYVPLDPAYPAERLALMLEDAGATVLVSRGALAGALPADRAETAWVLDLDRPEMQRALAQESAADPIPRARPENLAYVLYTSGSTGRPKGVAMSHGALANLVAWQIGSTPGPLRTAQFAPFSFDASFQEIACTWCAGGALVLVPEEARRDPELLRRLLGEQRVERLFLPFVALQQLAETARNAAPPAALREVITAGEALQIAPAVAELMARLGPEARLHNHYGPTEAHVVTFHILTGPPEAWPALPPIGRPIDNDRVRLLDRAGQIVPPGTPGELFLGGAGLARGYLGRPDLTAERFVPDPSGEPGSRLYRTGDLGRLGAGGELEFLGRIDHQVKVRGYRIEPGEIEAALAAHPEVAEAVAGVEERGDSRRLVAYVVAREGRLPGDLRDFLKARLPEYLVPSAFVPVAALPLTPSGKVDRRALSRLPSPAEEAAEGGEVPRGPVEQVVAGIWGDLLEIGRVGLHDDFFDLGGHSLLATRLLSRLRDALGIELSLRDFFEEPTVAGLAARAEAARRAERGVAAPPIVPIPRPGGVAARLPLSFAQERIWLVEQLQPGSGAYNTFQATALDGELDVPALARALVGLRRRHETLRTRLVLDEAVGTAMPPMPSISREPVQVIDPPETADGWPLPVVDLAALSEDRRLAELRRLSALEAGRPFDLARGPLFRSTLLLLGERRHALLLNLHHTVCDAWSLEILVRELGNLYRGAPLPDLPIQYGDYACWQRDWLQGEVLDRQLGYWRRHLGGDIPVLDLPVDRPRPAVQSSRGGFHMLRLPADFRGALDGLARRSGGSLFTILAAAFQVLLHRYTGQDRIHLGTPVTSRNRLELEPLIGFFGNTLVLATDFGGDPPAGELLRRVRDLTLEAFDHQDLPFEKLVAALQKDRDLSRQALFQALFVLQSSQGGEGGRLELPGLTLAAIPAGAAVLQFDLILTVHDWKDGLGVNLGYNADLFEAPTMGRFLDGFRRLLEAVAEDPSRRLSELPLLSESERHQVLAEWPDHDARGLGLADRYGKPVPIGVAGHLPGGERLRYRADGTLAEPFAAAEEGDLAAAAAERRQAQLDQRRKQVSSRRSQLSPERLALLQKWVDGTPKP